MDKESSPPLKELGESYEKCFMCLEEARLNFIRLRGVLGVGIGPRERGRHVYPVEPCLIVYVERKMAKTDIFANELIPREFRGVPVDVVEAGRRKVSAHNRYDAPWLGSSGTHGLKTGWKSYLDKR